MSDQPRRPSGEPYDWYVRARELRSQGSHDAAAELLTHLLDDQAESAHARELLAQAYFDARRWELALEQFLLLAEQAPDDDYARYGAGMTLWRLWRFTDAVEHLELAAVMRPDSRAYEVALRQVRATLKAREEAGYPLDGPLDVRPQEPPDSPYRLLLPESLRGTTDETGTEGEGPTLTPRDDT
jgi:tetratricopeptide (TPR) repeat protein